jgi:hypothetical protein
LPSTTTYKAGDFVAITGTGLSGASVKINGVVCTINSNDATTLNFTYPAIVAGSYEVYITVSNGWTYPQFMSTTSVSIDSAATATGSYQGAEFKVSGNGLPSAS